ncbi:hypothetical protein MOB40_11390 [Bacillus inaquosorum]|uniref:Uncharacterized protein n=1 Tax=Bacillus inaquosorum KCTC 13429 TaxID=1236548 RepID=A0A9W5LMF0_9BACI|nr:MULTISPECIES: hypothetical protein [Bacillus]RKQ24573.1 hypothetical protein D3797_000235 [Bacillus subtilis]AWM19159.1 hypothetical protein DKG76_21695 [Bacillus inaquosorum]ELS63428.1 hypothetical protein BSI_08190 [Bacillus inaquosorum KCTC 13429]MCE0741672.1 hypothetical protein [Bacillus sp. G16]MCY7905511.1 hypothetical protein [Bacillus inaquosorum]
MIKNIIGTTLILISFVVFGINWLYLEPRGLEEIPYWIVFVGALCGGFIKYYNPNQKNTNENMSNGNGKTRKIGKTIDHFIDAVSGDIDSGDRDQRMNNKPKK